MNRTLTSRFIPAFAIGLLAASAAVAQPGRGAGMGMPRYDKSTETTVTGTIAEVKPHQGRMGGTGTHLALRTEAGMLDVHVGPTNWLISNKHEFAAGEQIEVIGSRVKVDGQDAFLARQITRGGATIVLRNENGIPVWSGAKRPPKGAR